MRAPFRRFALALVAAAAVAAAAACSSSSSQGQDTVRAGASPVAPVPGARLTTLAVPASQDGGALSTPHTLIVPAGWTIRVWARIPDARMEAWTPEGNLLVSSPGGRPCGPTVRTCGS
jgi:hypothetical protein